MSSKYKGNLAEKKACIYLEEQNFKILQQNFYAKKLGEIDIIAKKNDTYHFIEVKSALDYETAINNITPNKISKIKRSIDYYLQIKKLDVSFCIDVIIITDTQLDFIQNITI